MVNLALVGERKEQKQGEKKTETKKHFKRLCFYAYALCLGASKRDAICTVFSNMKMPANLLHNSFIKK